MNGNAIRKSNPLVEKSFLFSVMIVKLCKYLRDELREYDIARQLIKAGTSVGANIEEANGAVSDADFKNKRSISYKECRESLFWLKLLHATNYIDTKTFESHYGLGDELCRMLRSLINTLQNKIQPNNS